ncbi:MAG: efflux RND transporter periplasmic adaptor subunit [Granulosicoccus sp.]|nr:efflux RND transporter periplasmic adaptor subunit [Granulosicoccus sp.]
MRRWIPPALVAVVLGTAIVGWLQFSNAPEQRQSQASGAKPDAGSGNGPGPGAESGTVAGAGPGPGKGPSARSRPASLVVVQPVTTALINDRLKAVGNGAAISSVSVVPLSAGLLAEVLVSSGQKVAKGDVLARLDDEDQLIARDRASSAVDIAAIEEARLAKLYRSRTTTEAELIRSRADLANARLTLREAELTLARRSIKAPISGVVGLVRVDVGNYLSTQTEIVTIDDRSTIIIEFWVPERFASHVSLGQRIEATAQANPSQVHVGTITGIGSRVESDSRTLPVQAQVDNGDDSLRPGMSFNISLNFAGQSYPAVDPLAIQWNSTGSFVWRLDGDTVQRVPVQIIQRNPESVLVASDLQIGDQVVTEGLLALRPGASVRVQGASSGTGSPAGARPARADTVSEQGAGSGESAAQTARP